MEDAHLQIYLYSQKCVPQCSRAEDSVLFAFTLQQRCETLELILLSVEEQFADSRSLNDHSPQRRRPPPPRSPRAGLALPGRPR